jgi:uncharacterized protein
VELALIFVTGLLLSLHCVGMCGGFVALLAVRPAAAAALGPPAPFGMTVARSWNIVLPEQLVFHAGRIATYTALGAVAGALGSLSALVSRTGRAQAILMVAAGVVMFWTGLALAGFLRHWSMFKAASATPQPWMTRLFGSVLRLSHPVRALPLGALLGFLPCGLIYAMLGKAASTGSARSGALVMLAFGSGTIPALLLVAFFANLFSLSLREKLVRVSGMMLAGVGALTLCRGVLWLMHPAQNLPIHHVFQHLSS